jgi:protein-S-isoprenylcysteine O-methyltransferase Ste14
VAGVAVAHFLTLAMFPVLVWMYINLARIEEREAVAEFGDGYKDYMNKVPGFFPDLRKQAPITGA